MTRIFVYGTLLRGMGNWGWALKDQTFIGTAETLPEYYMVSVGGFPGVCEGGDITIYGEVFEVDDNRLKEIDKLEGYRKDTPKNGMYDKILITLKDGTEAYMYTFNSPGSLSKIESGSWRKHTNRYLKTSA